MNKNQLVNPYEPFVFSPNNFVTHRDIIGRDILDYLIKRTQRGSTEFTDAKHVVILGDGGTGKT